MWKSHTNAPFQCSCSRPWWLLLFKAPRVKAQHYLLQPRPRAPLGILPTLCCTHTHKHTEPRVQACCQKSSGWELEQQWELSVTVTCVALSCSREMLQLKIPPVSQRNGTNTGCGGPVSLCWTYVFLSQGKSYMFKDGGQFCGQMTVVDP